MNKISSYVNGNTIVFIYDDGTKERYVKDGEEPRPQYPESIDLKITNRCNMGCKMCAECSHPNGEHADLSNPILKTIHPYTELAIGGGNPLEHPDLDRFLTDMKAQKVICNLTVNVKHFMDNVDLLKMYSDNGLIHGLGISLPDSIPDGFFAAAKQFSNAVIHTIAGWTPFKTYFGLANKNLNLLILGYKLKGCGRNCWSDDIADNIKKLSALLPDMFGSYKTIAFDNLAVNQLGVQNIISEEEFDKLYMGNDGEYTMYIDLVTNNFAKSSTHVLSPIDASSIDKLFTLV